MYGNGVELRLYVWLCAPGREAKLECRAKFPFLENSPWDIWWTVDGKPLASLTHNRFHETNQ